MAGEVCDLLLAEYPFPIGLVTSSYRLEVEPVLEAVGVRHRFAASVFGEEVKNLKTHPEPYLLAAERLGVSRPLVFEDSEAGLASAAAAGFDATRVPHSDDLVRLFRSRIG